MTQGMPKHTSGMPMTTMPSAHSRNVYASIYAASLSTSAMLAIAEDVRQQLHRNAKARLRAWGYLVTAIFDLCCVADPSLTDNLGQERGLQIAAVVLKEAA